MRGRGSIAMLAAVGALALGFVAQAAYASPRDASSTHALIAAGYRLASVGVRKIPIAERRARGVISKIASQCPGAAQGAPQDEEAQRMGLEAAGALWSAAYGTARAQIDAFVRAVKPLRWSDPKLTRRVQTFAHGLGVLGSLPMPDLCGDVAKWRASGYTQVPASTETYDKLVEQTEIHAISEAPLRRYERSGDHRLALQIKRDEGQIERAEVSVGFEDWNTLLEKLDLPQ